jgi:AcrR family transcriptional regulator
MPSTPGATRSTRTARAATPTEPVVGAAPVTRRGPGRGLSIEEILDAAVESFATKSYLGTNLEDVSERLGVKRQALYYYFPRKHDLLVAIIENIFDEFDRRAAEAVEGVTDPLDRLRALVRSHFEVAAGNPRVSRVAIHEQRHLPPAERRALRGRRDAHHNQIVDAYAAAAAAGQVRAMDAKLATWFLVGPANWMVMWYQPQGPMKPSEIAALADDLIFGGFGVRPTAKRR